MTKKASLLIVVILVAAGAAGVFWKVRVAKAKAVKLESEILRGLTAEEIVLILENQSLVEPSKTIAVVQSAETRKAFLTGLREYLSLAARARREGLADDPNIKLNLEYKKNSLLAALYLNKLDNEQKQYHQIPKEQIAAIWSRPENEKQFNAEMQALRAIQKAVAESTGNPMAVPQLQGEAVERVRESWAKSKILSDMAKADAEFIKQRAVELRLRVAETGVLASNYLNKHWMKNVKVTDEDVAAYLAAHPEYDLRKKREKAEMVLRRATAGEDFKALAGEFSEDRSTKSKGGLYENVEKGFLWPEVQTVALGLEKNQIAERLVETKDGYHVVQLTDKQSTKDDAGTETVKFSVRHILLQKRFEEPGQRNPDIPPPFMTPREIAEAAVRTEKRKRFVDEVVRGENISLPDDFPFEVTEELKASGTRIENLMKDGKVVDQKEPKQATTTKGK